MALKTHTNIPAGLHQDKREHVAFFQALLDYQHQLIQTGMRVKWNSNTAPSGNYLQLNGSVITNSAYPALVAYAAGDTDYVVGATTTTLPTDPGFWVKT